MVIPKGRIQNNILNLLSEAGIKIKIEDRSYRPFVYNDDFEVKIMKPQNIPQLIELGSHDIGFTGYDWTIEHNTEVQEILDLGFDPVKIVAAIPEYLDKDEIKNKKIVVVSEYEKISKDYLDKNGFNYVFMRTFGATEVFPPDDADMIIDNTSTGRTLKENRLKIIDTVLESTTRFIMNKNLIKNEKKYEKIIELKTLFLSILEARKRVMLEMNVPNDKFQTVIDFLPSMRSPTVAKLHGEEGYAVKIAVKKEDVPNLISKLIKNGATDILEYELRKVIA